MAETSARLLRLLSLLQARKEWSGTELAHRLSVSTRTVRNDIERLRSMGYPVNANRGNEGGYQLGAGASLPPLLLDDDEAVAVTIGLRNAASGNVDGIEESSVRALAKLEQVLPSRLQRQVSTLGTFTVPVAFDKSRDKPIDAGTLTLIAAACRDNEVLRFTYQSAADDTTRRAVEPFRLANWGRRWYLVAFDCGRDDWRTFRVDRMDVQPPAGPRFEPRTPPFDDVATYVREGAKSARWKVEARVTVHMNADQLAQQLPPWVGVVEPLSEKACILNTGGPDVSLVAAYLGLLPCDFEVTEPHELVDALRTLAGRYSRATN